MTSKRKEIRKAYSDMFEGMDDMDREMDYTTDLMNHRKARQAVGHMPQYNRFDPEIMREKIDLVGSAIDPTVRIALGRESSPVVYFFTHFPEQVKQAMEPWPEEILTGEPAERRAVENGLPEAGGTRQYVRVWWD